MTTSFRSTEGLPGRLATRPLQPDHHTNDPRGVAAGVLDGLLLGCGDAVIGINPATDSTHVAGELLRLLDDVRTLGYQSLAFHDVLSLRHAMGLRPAPEFEAWLDRVGLLDAEGGVAAASPLRALVAP